MTQQEILDFNKRCAEFLGADVQDVLERIYIDKMEDNEMIFHNHSVDLKYYEWDGKKNIHYIPFEYLQFHLDWNWIHEVIEAIEKSGYDVVIAKTSCSIWIGGTSYSGSSKDCKTKKEAVVQAINQFLIWYEQNK